MTPFEVMRNMRRAGDDPPVRTAGQVPDSEIQARIVPRDQASTLRIAGGQLHPDQMTAFA